jgi:hypothetical protein
MKRNVILWKASLLFILVSGALIAADQLSIHFGFGRSQQVVDDFLGGFIAGSIFYLYERHRIWKSNQHLHVIDLMNHHIRNALQPLMFVTDEPEGKAQMDLVEECVRRIDWALHEALPDKSEEDSVTRGGGSAGRSRRIDALHEGLSSEAKRFRREPALLERRPLFSQWLDTWKSRNEKAS